MGLGHIGESVMRQAFRRLDRNRNGRLDFSEALGAINMLKSQHGGGHHGGHGGGFF
jgi:hypothetical protein